MATLSGLPPGVLGKVLGERVVLHDRFVSVKSKKGEVEDAVLLRTDHQILLLTPKGRVLAEFHLLDVKRIESRAPDEMTLTLDKRDPLTLRTPHCDELIAHIRVGFARDFPHVREDAAIQLALTPPARVDGAASFFPEFDFKAVPVGPCDGFSRTYKSLCVYHGLPIRDDIVWDMDNIVHPKGVREFNFAELDDIENSKDVVPLLGALESNRWFTSLQVKDIKLSPDGLTALASLMRGNTMIERLELSNIGGATDKFFVSLGDALARNTGSALLHLSLPDNAIKDEGFGGLATAIQTFKAGLVSLNLANCSLGKKAAVALGQALRKNLNYVNSLAMLDLSNNPGLGPEGVGAVADFLAQPNNVKRLLLGNTNANIEALFAPLARGCTQTLAHLDLSNNKFAKKPSVSQASFDQLVSSVVSLKHLDLCGTKVPTTYLESLLSRVAGNAFVNELVLRLCDNDFSALSGSVFQRYLAKSSNIIELDVSDNDLMGDDGILQTLKGLKNSAVQRLLIERMFKTRTKLRDHVVLELASLLNSDRVKLTMLSLANCGLKGDIIEVLDAIGSNENLIKLDVSGNLMGDKGAFALSKALQKNKTLRKLVWDNNGTTIAGYSAFVIAMSRNRTLQQMPPPLNDLLASLKVAEARTRAFMSRMDEILVANQRPERLDGSAAVDTSQGQVLNATQQDALDRLTVQVKRLQANLPDEVRKTADAQQLKDEVAVLLSDVESNRQLSGLLASSMEGLQAVQDGKLTETLDGFVSQLQAVLEAQFEKASSEAVDLVRNTLRLPDAKMSQLRMYLKVGANDFDQKYLHKVLVQQVAAEIAFGRAASMASVVSIANNFVYERLQERLEDALERLQTLSKVEAPAPVSEPASAVSPSSVQTPAQAGAPTPTTDEVEDETGTPPAALTAAALAASNKKKNRQSRRIDADELAAPQPTTAPPKPPASAVPAASLDAAAMHDMAASNDSIGTAPATLTHMTKARPVQANKRLPSRQPRPSRGASTRHNTEESESEPSGEPAASPVPASRPAAAAATTSGPPPLAALEPPAPPMRSSGSIDRGSGASTLEPSPPAAAIKKSGSIDKGVAGVAAGPVAAPAPAAAPAVPAGKPAAAAAAVPVPAPEPEEDAQVDRKKSGFFSKVFGGAKRDDKPAAKAPVPAKPVPSPTAAPAAASAPAPAHEPTAAAAPPNKSVSAEKLSEDAPAPTSEPPAIAAPAAEPEPEPSAPAEAPKVPPKVLDKPSLKPKLPPGAVSLGMPLGGAAMAQQQQALAAIAQRKQQQQQQQQQEQAKTEDDDAKAPAPAEAPASAPIKPMPKPPGGFKLPPVVPKPGIKPPVAAPQPAAAAPEEPGPAAPTPATVPDDAPAPAEPEPEPMLPAAQPAEPPAIQVNSEPAPPVPAPKRRPLPTVPTPAADAATDEAPPRRLSADTGEATGATSPVVPPSTTKPRRPLPTPGEPSPAAASVASPGEAADSGQQ